MRGVWQRTHASCDTKAFARPASSGFEKTIAIPKFYMETYRESDFFEEFAADWGGCNCGRCDVTDFLRYVRALAEDRKSVV